MRFVGFQGKTKCPACWIFIGSCQKTLLQVQKWKCFKRVPFIKMNRLFPPVRWGLLDFMSVSSPPSRPPRPPPPLLFLLVLLLPLQPRCLSVASMWCAGPQPRSCEFSVACRTSTAILWVQCGVPDPNREPVSSVVACRTPTASTWVQCGVPDPNRDPVSSVWRAGPQPRSCECSVACRTSTAIPASSVWRAGPSTAIERISSSCRKNVSKK